MIKKTLAFHPFYGWALVTVMLSGFIAASLSLQAGLFVLLFVAVAWFVWNEPEDGFVLFLVLLPILPMLKITQTIGTASLIKDVIIIALFVRLVVVPFFSQTLPYRRNILWAPIVALVLWSALATLRADSLILGVLRLRDIGLYILLYFVVLYLPSHSSAVLRRRLTWFSVAVAATIGLAVWQWFFVVDSAVLRFDPVASVWIPRISSVLAHPSIYGEYLLVAFTLFAPIALLGRGKAQLIFGSLAIVLLPALFLTYSRAVWLGTAAAVGVIGILYVWRLVKKRVSLRLAGRWGVSAAVVGLLVFGVLLRTTPAGGLLRSIVDPTYGSNEERVTFFVRLIAPTTTPEVFIGRGLGDVLEQNFRQVDLEAYDIAAGDSRAVQLTKNRTLVDNQYLKTFVELGVIGLVLYLWIFWRFSAAAVQLSRSKELILGSVGLWASGFLAAFMLQALFIDIWDVFPTNALFWIVAAHASVLLVPQA